MTYIPEPTDTGSSGTQRVLISETDQAAPDKPLAGLPIVQMVEGLAATRSRSLGGEVAAGLIAGSFSQLSHELTQTKQELREVRKALDDTKEKLSEEKITSAKLHGEIDSFNNEKAIRSVCLVAGTAVIGFGIDQSNNSRIKLGAILILIGIGLSLVGWFSVGRRKAQ